MSLWSNPNPEVIVDFDADDGCPIEPVERAPEACRVEPRYPASAVPAITAVRTFGGDPLALINISVTGVLIEGSNRIKPGERITLVITGLDPATVSGHAVRSVVAAIGGNGTLRFQTGIAFDRRVELPLPTAPLETAQAPIPIVDTPARPETPAVAPTRRVVNRW